MSPLKVSWRDLNPPPFTRDPSNWKGCFPLLSCLPLPTIPPPLSTPSLGSLSRVRFLSGHRLLTELRTNEQENCPLPPPPGQAFGADWERLRFQKLSPVPVSCILPPTWCQSFLKPESLFSM